MRRAAVSIPSNIAEGHSRSLGDYIRHLRISAGSLTELETQFELCVRLDFIARTDAQPLLHMCSDVGRMLWSLRTRLDAKRLATPDPRTPIPGSR